MAITRIPRVGTAYPESRLFFRGGLNNSVIDELIASHELSAVENYIPDLQNAGAIIKREGLTAASTVQTEAATSIHQGKNANYFTTSTNINSFAGTSLATITSSEEPDWVTFLDNDIMANGADAPQTSTNGTTFGALGGAPPVFRYLAVHNNFLFGAGHSLGVLRWANLGTVGTWTATNGLTITNDQNDDIMGLAAWRGVLYVFCRRSFHHVNGFTTLEMGITHSAYGVGCTSHRSIVPTPFALFWWTDSGIAMSKDGFNVTFPALLKIPNTLAGLNKDQYDRVHGVWDQQERCVKFFVHNSANQTTPNMAIYYYYEEDTFWPQTGTGAQMGASGTAVVSGDARVYVGSAAAASSYLYYQDDTVNTDDGTPIAAFLRTKRDAPLGPTVVKRSKVFTAHVLMPGTVTLDYGVYLDNSDSLDTTWTLPLTGVGFVLGTDALGLGILGTGIKTSDVDIGFSRKYRKIKHQFSDNNIRRTRLVSVTNRGFVVNA